MFIFFLILVIQDVYLQKILRTDGFEVDLITAHSIPTTAGLPDLELFDFTPEELKTCSTCSNNNTVLITLL